MHSSVAVANKFLELAKNKGDTISPMQLIKLVYLSHGWMLGVYGRPLLNESVEAWRYGPVVPDLYHRIKRFRDMPVSYPITNMFGMAQTETFTDDESALIAEVYRLYGDYSGISLSNLTHQTGSPWEITWTSGGQNAGISNDLIEDHYKKLYASYNATAAH